MSCLAPYLVLWHLKVFYHKSLKSNKGIKSYNTQQTDVLGRAPQETLSETVRSRLGEERARENTPGRGSMWEWAEVMDTSADLTGSSGAGMTLQSCPSKGKGQLYTPPSSSQQMLAVPRKGRCPQEQSSFLMLMAGPGEGSTVSLQPQSRGERRHHTTAATTEGIQTCIVMSDLLCNM